MATSVFWGHLFPRDIMALFSFIKRSAEHAAVFHWHGSYYSFDGRQVRFFLVDDIIWIPLGDLDPIIEPEFGERELRILGDACTNIPGRNIPGVTEEGLMQLLKTRTESRHASYKMIRFKRWLLSSALHNVKRLPSSAVNHSKS
jgi:hypothetical protein